jgi:transposase
VLELKRQKISNREIARRLNMHRSTVRRFLNAGTFPERATRTYYSRADSVAEYLRQRWEEGCQNAVQLTNELRQRGFDGSYDTVRRRVARWRQRSVAASTGPITQANPKKVRRPSSNCIAWLLLYPPSDADDPDQLLLEKLRLECSQLAIASKLATEFVSMLKDKKAAALGAWTTKACLSELPELRRFAEGLKTDWEAVKAAFTLPWSNGQTEGHVNRLKMIKRQMFGRAKFDLLRQRFLNPA